MLCSAASYVQVVVGTTLALQQSQAAYSPPSSMNRALYFILLNVSFLSQSFFLSLSFFLSFSFFLSLSLSITFFLYISAPSLCLSPLPSISNSLSFSLSLSLSISSFLYISASSLRLLISLSRVLVHTVQHVF